MWEYNKTENMYCPELYHNPDELYHYGVLGMRWRHRKNASVQAANAEYRKYKKEARRANIKRFFSPSTYLAGVNNNKKSEASAKKVKSLRNKREQAAFKLINAAAKDAYNKKLAKTGDKAKAEKASMKVHIKAFNQSKYDAGRVGSIADAGGGQQRYYNNLVKTKGKKYADKVDIIQIGCRNMYNYELLKEVGKLNTPVILKRGLSATYNEWINAAKYNRKTTKALIGAAAGTAAYYYLANKYGK